MLDKLVYPHSSYLQTWCHKPIKIIPALPLYRQLKVVRCKCVFFLFFPLTVNVLLGIIPAKTIPVNVAWLSVIYQPHYSLYNSCSQKFVINGENSKSLRIVVFLAQTDLQLSTVHRILSTWKYSPHVFTNSETNGKCDRVKILQYLPSQKMQPYRLRGL